MTNTGAQRANDGREDDLLLAIIHDIRGHLRKSMTRAQMLERQSESSLAPELQGHLDEILASGREMDVLLNRLAKLAVAGKAAKEKPPGPLAVMFDSVLRRLSARNVDAEIDSSLYRSTSVLVPYSFETVLYELLDNSLKFRHGPVRITLQVDESPEKNVFGVNDTGIGFEPRFFEKIMRPLERLHPASVYPGCGLGLAICQRTIEAWGGTIWAESKLGGGSTFWFSLPAPR
jgi:signal transduction histidine kinase